MMLSRASIRGAARGFSTAADEIYTGVILSRIPIVSRDVDEFESKYYHYQSELERRLMWTFPQYYYFRKGTLSERKFLDANRGPVSYQPGVYYPKGLPDIKHNRERSAKQEIVVPREESASTGSRGGDDNVTRPIAPISRVTKADEQNDVKSLERKLSRTLYLLTKQDNVWKFPVFKLSNHESTLGEVVESSLELNNDKLLKSWLVSGKPTAVLKYNTKSQLTSNDDEEISRREFLLKSHIIAGSFEPKKELNQIQDYQWCTKEEIKPLVDIAYYDKIECLLSNV